jgi:hypothetical protein
MTARGVGPHSAGRPEPSLHSLGGERKKPSPLTCSLALLASSTQPGPPKLGAWLAATIRRARRLSSRRRFELLRALVARCSRRCLCRRRRRRRRRRAGSPEGWGARAQLRADWAPTFPRPHLLPECPRGFSGAQAAHPITPHALYLGRSL